MYRTHDLVDLVQKGIPEKYRVDIWMIYSGEGGGGREVRGGGEGVREVRGEGGDGEGVYFHFTHPLMFVCVCVFLHVCRSPGQDGDTSRTVLGAGLQESEHQMHLF